MIENLSKTRRNVALALLAVLVIWFSWTVRSVLNPVVLAYIFASSLHPMVRRVEQRGWSRRAAVNLIFVGFCVVLVSIALGVYAQGRMMVRDVFDKEVDLIGRVERSFDAVVEEHGEWLAALLPGEDPAPADGDSSDDGASNEGAVSDAAEPTPQGSAADAGAAVAGTGEAGTGEAGTGEAGTADAGAADAGAADAGAADAGTADGSSAADEPGAFSELLREAWAAMTNEQSGAGEIALRGAGSIWNVLRHWFGSVLGFFTLSLLLPLYTYFLLFELGRIRRFFRRYLPIRERRRVSHVASQIGEVLASFFRGRLLICFLKGLVITVGLWIAGIPYALLLGMGSGFLALVPFVGPLLGFLVAFSMGLLPDNAHFLGALLRVGVVFGLAEVVEGYVLIPKILGDSLGLHPMVVLVAVFTGGAALGVFGLLIAIPLAASLVIVMREFVLPALAQFADEEQESAAGEGG